MPDTENVQLWMTFPCGQTEKRKEYTSSVINDVVPCDRSPDWNCFESRLPDLAGEPVRSDVFLAIPKNYGGGHAKWETRGVEFVASPVSNSGEDDISVIVARRLKGTIVPERQKFIFSVRNGLLAAMVFDERLPMVDGIHGVQVYLLAQRIGLFARP